MLFIGRTRFSLYNPNSTSWKASNGSRFANSEEYRDYLYSDERLAARTEIFVRQSLPQIELARDGHKVRHIVSYSDTLPPKYQAALEEAAARYPFLILDRNESGRVSITPESVAKRLLNEQPHMDPTQAFGIYRLDDDDLLPVSFFDRNAPYIRSENAGMNVSLGTGITALQIEDGYFNARRCYNPMFTAGLMNVCKFLPDGTLLEPKPISHNLSDRANPVILDSRNVGYLWGRSIDQDTALGLVGADDADLLDQLRNRMNAHPPVADFEEIRREFPVVADRVFLAAGPGHTRQVLLSNRQQLVADSIPFLIDEVSGTIEVTIDLACGAGVVPQNALLSFDLVGPNGASLDRDIVAEPLRKSGISTSGIKEVGFFRYLQTAPGRRPASFTLELPQGVSCRGLTVRKWKRSETKIQITELTVSSS